jgi:hypothetical protein
MLEVKMNTLFKEHTVKNEIESWKVFADSLHTKEDKEHFKEMLREYYQYCIVLRVEPESFPSEELVLALISSQYKKIIHWLMEKGFKI